VPVPAQNNEQFWLASQHGELPTVTALIAKGANVNSCNDAGCSSLYNVVTDVREVHCWKALLPMLVTDDGIVTDVRELLWKAEIPMLVTDVGMLTVLRAVQPEKALSGILVVPSGMIACPFASGVTIQSASAPFHPSKSTSKSVVFITFYDWSTLSRILRQRVVNHTILF
jgi:hypothetical protein